MGISTAQTTRDHGSLSHTTIKQHQEELDIEHVLTQLTLEEKISLTAGQLKPAHRILFIADMM
jgi:beta-glucosidase